ncbi:MAG TPA: hypothetical protein VEQ11_08325 [Chloroflexota bacterium]|nr:hypothetical protein [Chloroflexota bacterium]
MPEAQKPQPLIDYAHHRQDWLARRDELKQHAEPARFTVRATVELLHDFLKEARVRNHTFRSDEAAPGGGDEAPNPLGYFVAAVGF